MGRFRLESYRGRSMESGPDGWDGISRAVEDNTVDDDLEMKLARQALMEVPSDYYDDYIALVNPFDDIPPKIPTL